MRIEAKTYSKLKRAGCNQLFFYFFAYDIIIPCGCLPLKGGVYYMKFLFALALFLLLVKGLY